MWASGAYGYLSDYLWWWVAVTSILVHTWCFFRFFPRNRFRKSGLLIGNLLVLLCMLSILGTLGETYVRFLVVETDSYGESLLTQRWVQVYPKLNSLYCRDVEWAEKKPDGVYRIAFIGDSFVYGWGINNAADRFTDIIQRRFDERQSGRVEVMNVAWAGWDTRAELGAVHDMIRDYAVDEVVLCFVPNDIESLIPTTADFDPKKPPRPRFINIESSFLLDYLFHRVFARFTPTLQSYWDWLADGYGDPAVWADEQRLLDRIIDLCSARHVRLRVALLPFVETRGDRFNATAIQSRIASHFAARDVRTVDLLSAIQGTNPDELVVNSHDPHPNELANRLFADAIWKAFYRTVQLD